ncbi:ARPP-2 domain-containing protein [Streptomyces tsukubensis]|uniref:ARPP-2 domain-containing protein n=1 Tax=Streptomyces tsukubensis TaxID=83656 RepID=UPI00344CF60D
MSGLDMTGLTTGPAQVWGGIRLVPLLRDAPVAGLRLHRDLGAATDDDLDDPCDGPWRVSYVPHAFVADWSGDGAHGAAYGTRLGPGRGPAEPARIPVSPHRRPVRRVRERGRRGRAPRATDRLRFLPLQLALAGYLTLHFRGPSIAWDEWSRSALQRGLSPREEAAYAGASVPGLGEALRVFEIHPRQCGVLLYAADALAAAFVVPHPADYRALHRTLVEDLYGELVYQYAYYARPLPAFEARLGDGRNVRTTADLRASARRAEAEWRRDHDSILAAGLLADGYRFERVYAMDGFTLQRFLPGFVPGREQHIGELIRDHKGRTAYLKTFRLSEAQVRRGHLLDALHREDWHPERTAAALGTSVEELARRIRSAGFGSLLKHGDLR